MRIPSCRCRRRARRASPQTGLRAAGFDVTTGVGKTGVVGVLRNGEGPTVMLRADMDALPVRGGDRPAVREHGDRDRSRRATPCR